MKIQDLNLHALKYFIDAVENRSIKIAAEKNFLTRSAISQAIVRLEVWAGYRLTTHEKKSFRLTKDGEAFYRKMKFSVEGFQRSMEGFIETSNVLRIGCSQSLADPVLFSALRKLKKIDSLFLTAGTSSKLCRLLDEGEINIALFLGEKDPTDDNEFILRTGHFVLASKFGVAKSCLITTEQRPEVIALRKRLLSKKLLPETCLTVESWSLAAKLSLELDSMCLIPDFLLSSKLQTVAHFGFKYPFQMIMRTKPPERLSETECSLIGILTRKF